MNTPWPQADLDDLKRSWPTKSASTIGSRQGRTRSAVIGMAHRLFLPKKTRQMNLIEKVVTRKPTLRRKLSLVLQKSKVELIKLPPPPDGPVPLLEARLDQCRAIVQERGEDGLAVFCGKPVVEGKPFLFCSEHFRRFTVKGSAR